MRELAHARLQLAAFQQDRTRSAEAIQELHKRLDEQQGAIDWEQTRAEERTRRIREELTEAHTAALKASQEVAAAREATLREELTKAHGAELTKAQAAAMEWERNVRVARNELDSTVKALTARWLRADATNKELRKTAEDAQKLVEEQAAKLEQLTKQREAGSPVPNAAANSRRTVSTVRTVLTSVEDQDKDWREEAEQVRQLLSEETNKLKQLEMQLEATRTPTQREEGLRTELAELRAQTRASSAAKADLSKWITHAKELQKALDAAKQENAKLRAELSAVERIESDARETNLDEAPAAPQRPRFQPFLIDGERNSSVQIRRGIIEAAMKRGYDPRKDALVSALIGRYKADDALAERQWVNSRPVTGQRIRLGTDLWLVASLEAMYRRRLYADAAEKANHWLQWERKDIQLDVASEKALLAEVSRETERLQNRMVD